MSRISDVQQEMAALAAEFKAHRDNTHAHSHAPSVGASYSEFRLAEAQNEVILSLTRRVTALEAKHQSTANYPTTANHPYCHSPAFPPRWSYKQMKDAGEQLVQAVLNGDGFFQAMDNFYEKNLIPHTIIVPLWFYNEYRKRCVVSGSDTFWRATKLIPAGSDEDKSLFCDGGKW